MPGRRRAKPACLRAVAETCDALAGRLEGARGDVIALWRVARILKVADHDLRCHVDRLRGAPTLDVELAGLLLDDAEARLRLVLLDQDTMRPRQIERHVEQILDRVSETVKVLRRI